MTETFAEQIKNKQDAKDAAQWRTIELHMLPHERWLLSRCLKYKREPKPLTWFLAMIIKVRVLVYRKP